MKKPTILTDEQMRPGMEVEKHLREDGCCPTPERSVEEIVRDTMVKMSTSKKCHLIDKKFYYLEGDVFELITQTLQAERQKRDEMVEAEKINLAHKIKDAKCWANPNRGVLLSTPPQHRCDACGQLWYCNEEAPVCTYVKKSDFTNLEALTQPNNHK